MTFIEFIEAIGRVSEKLCIPNLLDDVALLQDRKWDEVINDKELITRWSLKPLSQKIECFLLVLGKNCLGSKFYNNEVIPQLQYFKSKYDIYANDIQVSGKFNFIIPFERND